MTDELAFGDDEALLLADDAATISALVRRTPVDRLGAVRFGDWSATELLAHLAESSEMFAGRVRRCADEDDPELPAWDQDAAVRSRPAGALDPMALSRRIQVAHAEIVRTIRRAGVATRTGRHADWGRVSAAHFGGYQAKHSHEHVVELAAAFPPGS